MGVCATATDGAGRRLGGTLSHADTATCWRARPHLAVSSGSKGGRRAEEGAAEPCPQRLHRTESWARCAVLPGSCPGALSHRSQQPAAQALQGS